MIGSCKSAPCGIGKYFSLMRTVHSNWKHLAKLLASSLLAVPRNLFTTFDADLGVCSLFKSEICGEITNMHLQAITKAREPVQMSDRTA